MTNMKLNSEFEGNFLKVFVTNCKNALEQNMKNYGVSFNFYLKVCFI